MKLAPHGQLKVLLAQWGCNLLATRCKIAHTRTWNGAWMSLATTYPERWAHMRICSHVLWIALVLLSQQQSDESI